MENETLDALRRSASSDMSADPSDDGADTSPRIQVGKGNGNKPKAQPTVTPRTFTRFFTPRSSIPRGSKISASRRALRDITASAAANRSANGRRRSPKPDAIVFHDIEIPSDGRTRTRKKRRTESQATTTVTPAGSSPLKHVSAPSHDFLNSSDVEHDSELDLSPDEFDSRSEQIPITSQTYHIEPITRSHVKPASGLLFRELGLGKIQHAHLPICRGSDWQIETANFYSNPRDNQTCENPGDPSKATLPFCSRGCNTNSLVAVGDEDGGVQLLETAPDGKSEFCTPHLTFRPHTNAIMDLAFSPDDMLLATAAGDQTSQIIDMPSQRSIYTLAAHQATVKQIKFQPGSANVIATSSRDGSVRLWDLRCKGSDIPAQELRISLDGPSHGQTAMNAPKKMTFARSVDSIIDAHLYRGHPSLVVSQASMSDETYDMPTRNQTHTRHGDHSITSLCFLPAGREHLLLTASEANASVRLWDLRITYSHRRSIEPIPVSSTRQPDSHAQHRTFGITSLAMSGDSARFYAYCRDNTIYAYSTNHLILGHAPELSPVSSNANTASSIRRSRFSRNRVKEGLGPIYGFRHPLFHATSFYVKLAVRPAGDGQSELLAAGSSDGCAVLWPTDERYMRNRNPKIRDMAASSTPLLGQTPYATPPPSSAPSSTCTHLPQTTSHARLKDTIPIYTHGTPLIRGHEREVTGLTWAYGGELVTVSDDCTARCWREDRGRARELRECGEGEGKRWGCGWADVGQGWDDDE